jgi:hypothetical protein
MTRIGYASDMSNTPSDPNIVNPVALEGFARAFDCVLRGKYDLSGGAMTPVPLAQTVRNPRPTMVDHRQGPQPSFWHTFPFLRTIICFRDNIRLRRYNREWIKNNIH